MDSPARIRSTAARNLTFELILLSGALILIVTSLVLLSGFSMEVLSSVRAYVGGEGLWSKAQKDAVLSLTRYARSYDEADYQRYLEDIKGPQGDHRARLELSKPSFDAAIAQRGFLEGRNHPDDIDRMIWLFRRFHDMSDMRRAITLWERADRHIEELHDLGARLHAGIATGTASSATIDAILTNIYQINDELTPIEDSFSQTLGQAARRMQSLLLTLLAAGGALLIIGGFVTCRRLFSRIQESERKYRQLIDTARDAIFIADGVTGRVLESNHKAEEMLGVSGRELIGSVQPLVPVTQSPAGSWKDFVDHVATGNGSPNEMRLRHGDGRSTPVEVSTNLIRVRGRLVVQSIVRDLTLRKQAEEALRAARDQALDASRIKSQFLANMSHEIRTPMNGVLGMLSLMLTTSLTEEQKEFAEVARESAESLLGVINDILDFSRIEAGRLEIFEEPFELREVAAHVIRMFRSKAVQKGLQLSCSIDPELPQTVKGDAARLRQVLTNLVNNAVKFTSQGSVTLEIHARTEVQGSPANSASAALQDWLRFEVRDTGIGISPNAQQRLFEAFSQADGSITRKYGGTGLGLAISKELVELMGGEIGISSTVGVGSTFWFRVPLKPVSEVQMEKQLTQA